MFEWQNATVGVEYMFISDGALYTDDYFRRAEAFYPDDLFYLGRHYAGASASMDIVPILRAGVMGIVNLTDGSGLAALNLTYNIADEADLVAGAMIPWGEQPPNDVLALGGITSLPSEFGIMPVMAFMETRFYF